MKTTKLLLSGLCCLSLLLGTNSCRKDRIIERIEVQKGANLRTGKGAPSLNIGEVGDIYIDIANAAVYGPKTASSWGEPFLLKGEKGDKGDAGRDGQDGTNGTNGTDGRDGTNGRDGRDGTNGKDGRDGSRIFHGTGAPDMSVGQEGDWYIDKANKQIYGPKTASSWGEPMALGQGTPATPEEVEEPDTTPMPAGAKLSADGKTLVGWSGTATSITLPRSVKKIASGALSSLSEDLEEIHAPGVVEVEANAFAHFDNLSTVDLPKAKILGASAFAFSSRISEVTLTSVEEIGEKCFEMEDAYYNALEELAIPNIKKIGANAFQYRTKLSKITFGSVPPTVGDNAFDSVGDKWGLTLVLPQDANEASFKALPGLGEAEIERK